MNKLMKINNSVFERREATKVSKRRYGKLEFRKSSKVMPLKLAQLGLTLGFYNNKKNA